MIRPQEKDRNSRRDKNSKDSQKIIKAVESEEEAGGCCRSGAGRARGRAGSRDWGRLAGGKRGRRRRSRSRGGQERGTGEAGGIQCLLAKFNNSLILSDF